VDETLRIVQALKLVDEYGGSALAPGDWRVGEPYIWNTRPGVDTFYAARAGLKSNVFSKIVRMVQSFFKQGQEEEVLKNNPENSKPDSTPNTHEVANPSRFRAASQTKSGDVAPKIKTEIKPASSGDEVKFIDIY